MGQPTPTGGNWNTGPAPGTTPMSGGGDGTGAEVGTFFAAVLLVVTGCLAIFQASPPSPRTTCTHASAATSSNST